MLTGILLTSCLVVLGARVAAAESDRDYCERQQGPAKIACMRDLARSASTSAQAAPATTPAASAESDRQYCERQQGPAKIACMRQLNQAAAAPKAASGSTAAGPASASATPAGSAEKQAAAGGTPGAPLYKVVDGYHVDSQTLLGFKTWRAAACDRCHGANQQGLVGPSLIESLKTLSKADFVKTVTEGRLQRGMPSFGANSTVIENIDHLYAYLKGRSDGAITKAHVVAIQ